MNKLTKESLLLPIITNKCVQIMNKWKQVSKFLICQTEPGPWPAEQVHPEEGCLAASATPVDDIPTIVENLDNLGLSQIIDQYQARHDRFIGK